MTTSTDSEKKTILLKSSDKEEFMVDEIVALQSQRIKHMIEDDCANNAIPLSNVTGKILSKVIEYCKKHVENKTVENKNERSSSSGAPASTNNLDDDLKAWDAEFVKVDQHMLFDFILAANNLDIKSLLDLTCQTFADSIKHMSPEEVRKLFNIMNDFN